MENFGSEIGQKMRSAVKAKLLELGTGGSAGYIDDELPDYVMIMVANKRSKQQMITDLNLFLGTQTELFVTWLHEVLQKLQEVTLPAASASSRKRKSNLREDPTTTASSSTTGNKKDRKTLKKDKKSAPPKKAENDTAEEHQTPTTTTGVNSTIPVINSITDVFAEDLLEKAKKTLDVNADATANIKKGKGKKATTESLPPSTAAKTTKRGNTTTTTTSEFDIPTISEISSTTEAVPSGNREKDLAELADIQKKIYAAKKHLKNLENYDEAESEDEDFLNLKDDGSAEEFNEAGDLVKKKSSRPKSPIVFDHKEPNRAASSTDRQKEQEHFQGRRRRITPPPAQTSAATPVITASSVDNRRAVSPSSKNRRDGLQPRLSRERERREPLLPHPKRSVHERLGLKPQQQQQQQQTGREDNTRDRRSRQEKELYVPAFRRREIEIERKRVRERGGRDDRDRGDRSSIRRRSSPEQQPILSSSSAPNANGTQRSQVVQMVTSSDVRRKRSDSGGAIVASVDVVVNEEEPRVQRQRIGSRVIVAATKPPEPSDDEDLIEKPVNSVIKIKPRPPVSPSKQACKNLLLRAVAEAQRSTILTQIKPTESVTKVTVRLGEGGGGAGGGANERSTKLYTKSYRDRLKRGAVATSSMLFRRTRQNLVIEVEGEGRMNALGNKRRRRNSEDAMEQEEYVPETVSDRGDSDGDYEYVPQMINESGDEQDAASGYHINEAEYEDGGSSNDLDIEKTQFVVTLNDDKPLPRYKHAVNARSRSHSPPPLVSSSSSASRNNGVEPSSTTTRNKRSRSREPRRGDIKSRLQLKTTSSLSPSTNARLGERESTNSSQSCNTPPPPRRSELIEIYRKPKEIKKIIIKNDSEDDDSPIKSAKHDKHESRTKSSHKRRSHEEPITERSSTPPMPPKKQRHSAGSAETKLTIATSPVRSSLKHKRTPIKFDLGLLDSRDLAREHGNVTATKSRSRSYERGSSIERRSGDEYHHTRQKISIRNSEAKKYENIPSLSSVAIDSTVMKVNKPKERCKYHPNCTKHNCDYYHPTAPCKSFPNCKFADKCMYSHPKCKFDMACTNIDCNYSHSGIRNPTQLQSQAPPLSSHVVPVQNYKSISAAPAASSTMCKYYPNCSKLGCTFYHPKPCRFGKNCINKLECNFYHHEVQSSSKFKWVASAV